MSEEQNQYQVAEGEGNPALNAREINDGYNKFWAKRNMEAPSNDFNPQRLMPNDPDND